MTRAAIQLYSLRDFNEPLPAIIDRVADAGFAGVEFAHRIRRANPDAVRDALDRTELEPVAAHAEVRTLEADWDRLMSVYETVGVDRVIIPHLPFNHFLTTSRIDETIGRIETIAARLADQGMSLGFHNTWEVFYPPLDAYGLPSSLVRGELPTVGWVSLSALLGGFRTEDTERRLERSGYGRLVEASDPADLGFEVDIKNVVAAGIDPERVYDLVGDRLSLIHLSDIHRSRRFPPAFEAVDPGTGLVDIDAALASAKRSSAEWIVFEHDRPADPESALTQGVQIMGDLLEPRVTEVPPPTQS